MATKTKENDLRITQDVLKKLGTSKEIITIYNKVFRSRRAVKVSEIFEECSRPLETLSKVDCPLWERVMIANWLAKTLPFSLTCLKLNTVNGLLFHNGNVHVRGNINTASFITVQGNLQVDGCLFGSGLGVEEASAFHVTAKDIYLRGFFGINAKTGVRADTISLGNSSYIQGEVKARLITLCDCAHIKGNTLANTLILSECARVKGQSIIADNIDIYKDAYTYGNTTCKRIKLSKGYIYGDVDADEVINDGGTIFGNVHTKKLNNNGRITGLITFK